MQHPTENPNIQPDEIFARLNSLESRISKLEGKLSKNKHLVDYQSIESEEADVPFYRKISAVESDDAMESKIGEYGLSWLGNIVLLFGIIFLLQYVQNIASPMISVVVGYVIVTGVFLLTSYLRKSFIYMAYMFNITGHLLLYYVTMRLHFFSSNPVLADKVIVIFLLLILAGIQIYFTIRRKSETFGVITLILLSVTAVISDSTHIMLPITTVIAVTAVVFFFRNAWWRLLFVSHFLVYITFLFWFLNNPFMGHPLQVIVNHQLCYLYIFAIAAIYSMVTLIKNEDLYPGSTVLAAVIINGLGFSFLIMITTLSFFISNYNWIFLSVSAFCIAFSIYLKYKSLLKATPSLYALYSFVALSIAFYGFYKLPGTFLLLAVESLLVLSMALWYRSKLIVVMNLGLFLMILTVYMIMNGKTDGINFTFAAVALISARVMNWQKERLEIQTELLRNIYLISTFCLVLFALYQAIPDKYVTLSWIAAAVFYFVVSIILKNKKYRWMALFTFIASALHIFVVDLAQIELIFKILAFLVLAVISIIISIYYNKKIKKQVVEET
jgi:hypothetical protein